jgi:tripartite-type tricarboxylate transporter receptor subunit TctC
MDPDPEKGDLMEVTVPFRREDARKHSLPAHALARILGVAAIAWAFGSPGAAMAQDTYPSKQVRLVVASPPGGGTDTIARLVAQQLSGLWKQSVVVENKTGASGNIAGQSIARSNPDGYTLLVSFGGSATINPFVMKDMGFDPMKDLAPVVALASSPMYVAVNPSLLSARSIPELLAEAKASRAPLSWGSAQGSADDLAGKLLGLMANVDLNHIPYKGGADALLDVLGGRVPFGVFSITAAMPYVKTGQLVAVGGTEKKRSSFLPNVPAVAESIPGYEAGTWYGVWAPVRTPTAVIEKINADMRQVLQGEVVRKRASELGLEPIGDTTSAFAASIRAEAQRHEKVFKALGVGKN